MRVCGRRACLIAVGAVLAGAALAAPDRIDSQFRIVVLDPHGATVEVGTGVVPRLPHLACYAWRVRVDQRDGALVYKEVFIAPSADGAPMLAERSEMLRDGWFGNTRCVAEDDPEGRYRIDVLLEDRLLERFDFEVREPD